MEIRVVDPHDAAAFEAWHATAVAAERSASEWATPWTLREYRAQALADLKDRQKLLYAGVVGGVVVCAADLELPQLDNRNLAVLALGTHPEHCRRGYATAMLEHVEQVARQQGRDRLLGQTEYALEAPSDGAGQPGATFLTARGFAFANCEVHRILDLPVPTERLAELTAAAAPYHAGYELHSFVGPVPERWIQGYASASASLTTEAPTGEIEFEPEVVDVAVTRQHEALWEKQGRSKYQTIALDPAGEVAGYTDLFASDSDASMVFQWGTLVRPEHRGHRLGLAMKAANHAFFQRQRPGPGRVHTWNAEQNSHMIAVNEQLGFRKVGRYGEFQKALA